MGAIKNALCGAAMIDHDNLEDFRDAEIYDLQDQGYYDDYPLVKQWVHTLGGPLLDLACGTGRMALRLAQPDYEVTGVDITPEMIYVVQRCV
jgi:ubiquinone/menaquinone biosynthesis C-methylase UbiE